LLDALTPDAVDRFRAGLAGALDRDAGAVVHRIGATGKLEDADRAALLALLGKRAAPDG
jgi:F-type H+-transporting ATPase subunit alpha